MDIVNAVPDDAVKKLGAHIWRREKDEHYVDLSTVVSLSDRV
jgi:hypothetical protein